MSNQHTIQELRKTLAEIETVISHVKDEASAANVSVYSLKRRNGDFVMAEMLGAKAMLLHAITMEKNGR